MTTSTGASDVPQSTGAVNTVTFPNGRTTSLLGQGTWYLGENGATHNDEVRALRTGIDLGLTLVDTAEMYGSGASERLVGDAIAGRRDDVFLVSKVLPSNASLRGTVDACRASLERLGTDHLDLYLLHWRGGYPLSSTVEAFETLLQDGLIRGWGVSNFDPDDMEELLSMPGGSAVQTNQILYNLARRGPEFDLIPTAARLGIPVMAYSPLDHGELQHHPVVQEIAREKGISAAQLAIAWVLRRAPNVFAVAKASTAHHVEANRAALDIHIADDELARLERVFPSPTFPQPLEMI